MISNALGSTAVSVSGIELGTYRYEGGVPPLQQGFQEGSLLIDTADSDGSEPIVGQAVQGMRDRVFIATKISHAHFRCAEVLKAADRSLRQLKVDYIDLYQLHRPNYFVPLAGTLAVMEKPVDVGKIRFIGVSNFSVSLLKQAQNALQEHGIVSNQVRYNLIDRTIEPRLLPFCQAQQITVIAYSPFSKNLQRLLDSDPRGTLIEIAGLTRKTVAQVAINWCAGIE